MPSHATPDLDLEDRGVPDGIHDLRAELRDSLAPSRRWHGMLVVTVDDAVAAVDEEEPLTADARVWAEITGNRAAMSYVLQAGRDPQFRHEAGLLRSVHFMLFAPDRSRSPGHYRRGPIFVRDDSIGHDVDEGPSAELVQSLAAERVAHLNDEGDSDAVVRAAMAHLNLVMIHPFRDGIGRMARALQTLVPAAQLWEESTPLVAARGLPERTTNALFDAASGFRVRRPGYAKLAEVENRTATRDLQQLVDAGLLGAREQSRGRSYTASSRVAELAGGRAEPLEDPYPGLDGEIRAAPMADARPS